MVSRLEGSRRLSLAYGNLEVEIGTAGPTIAVRRAGRAVIADARVRIQPFEGHDRFIHLTEGVIPEEQRAPELSVAGVEIERADGRVVALAGELEGGRAIELEISIPEAEHIDLRLDAQGVGAEQLRLGVRWASHDAERLTGLGARHGESFDQARRRVVLGADRRYTGPDCPPEMLAEGGIPQGDCAPAPWLLSSAGWALWAETFGAGVEFDLGRGVAASARAAAGPLRLHLLTDATPTARLRHYLRLTGFPALLPEWAYGHWKSRDVYEHQRDVVDDLEGYLENSLPLDAIVIDSPWATQYNTWRFNPHQFPDPKGLIERLRGAGVRTVVWVTPWVNVESVDGQRPPGLESERLHSEPAANYARGALAGHFVRSEDGRPWVGRWWMGTGSLVDFTSPAARRWWREQARGVLELGVEGIKTHNSGG